MALELLIITVPFLPMKSRYMCLIAVCLLVCVLGAMAWMPKVLREASVGEEALFIYAAASLAKPLEELHPMLDEVAGRPVRFNLASSGALAQSILARPQADIFLSANEAWMEELEAKGALLQGSREALFSNELVLIAHPHWEGEWHGVAALPQTEFRWLAVGDPGSVPAGQYARIWLGGIEQQDGLSVWQGVQARLAPTADVKAVLAMVESHREVLGVVYATELIGREEYMRVLHRVSEEGGPQIIYPGAVLRASRWPEEARALLAFMRSPEAQEVFARHGLRPLGVASPSHL